jgi:hypothetical protein
MRGSPPNSLRILTSLTFLKFSEVSLVIFVPQEHIMGLHKITKC